MGTILFNYPDSAAVGRDTDMATQQKLGIPTEWGARSDFDHRVDPGPDGKDLSATARRQLDQEMIRCPVRLKKRL